MYIHEIGPMSYGGEMVSVARVGSISQAIKLMARRN
jgi:hypothetical protein